MKKIAILGATGSIGLSTIEVVRQHPREFKIVLASTNNNHKKLFALTREFSIPNIVITNNFIESQITDYPVNTNIKFGEENLLETLKTIECDIVLNAIFGSAGLKSTMAVLSRGIDLALANKESLVMAGHLIQKMQTDSKLIPVDSEHSAIFQAIGTTPLDEIKSVILTASGGPFRKLPLNDFDKITIEQTLSHPTWKMGAKVTVDSATMMNKGLEVIEAHWLFHKDFDEIKTVIHPQSIIHSFIEFVDGSILAQMSFPTMKLPILFALSYPHHIPSNISKSNILDFPDLTFSEVEKERYPLFFLAKKAGVTGGLVPTILNAANEAAIDLFLKEKIHFTQIYKLVDSALSTENNAHHPDLDTIIQTNSEIYQKIIRDYKNILS